MAEYVKLSQFTLKHEGENPTGSFKDRGMAVGVAQARALKVKGVACASTGNTSAALASYAALADLPCLVFVPEGEIAYGKLAQALAYGAQTLQIRGSFDDALRLVQEVCAAMGVYLLNSLNPYRLEGQKTVMFELIQQRGWRVPDWIVLPGGNLGNVSAYGKAFREMIELGLADKMPRFAVIQASGANPFYRSFREGFKERFTMQPHTIATAIRIGDPASYDKARRVIIESNGVVAEVSDLEIMAAKAVIDAAGIGCEPASAASVAGTRQLVAAGIIERDADVVGILTGHVLKDTDATLNYHRGTLLGISSDNSNMPQVIDPTLAAVREVLQEVIG